MISDRITNCCYTPCQIEITRVMCVKKLDRQIVHPSGKKGFLFDEMCSKIHQNLPHSYFFCLRNTFEL